MKFFTKVLFLHPFFKNGNKFVYMTGSFAYVGQGIDGS